MQYEWDNKKNKINVMKHGIDFSESIHVFDAPMFITEDKRQEYGEERISGIGLLKNIFVVIVYTENDDKDIRRIITLRKATKSEKDFYENNI